MRLYRTISAICCAICLTACERPAPIIVAPDVPVSLRQPVTVPQRRIETVQDLATGYVEATSGLATANGRLSAIDCIFQAATENRPADCTGAKNAEK